MSANNEHPQGRFVVGSGHRYVGWMLATCASALWLLCWALILRGIGVVEDWGHFSVRTAIFLTAVTLVSPIITIIAASRFVARVPERHWTKYFTCGLCLIASPTIPWFAAALFGLWFWSVTWSR